MYPAAGSLTTIAAGDLFTVSVQVYKSGATDGLGQGAGIYCTVRLGRVADWGESWYDLGDYMLSYAADVGNNDEYQVSISPQPGKYEFTAFCTDTTDSTNMWQAGDRGKLQVTATCGGISYDNASVCNGHGSCTANDTCLCADGWEGANCQTQVFVCGGIRSDNASVCSGHGSCTANDTCLCADGWEGANCQTQVFVCGGIRSDNASVCSGHGSCTANDTCLCADGWSGQECAESVPSTTTTTAAGCIDNDDDGYGEGCEAGPDCRDNDTFYNVACPACTVRVIPGALGWFIGDRIKTRSVLVIGDQGTDFGDAPAVAWDSTAIETIRAQVFFKRFIVMRISINGETLEKGVHRVLINACEGTLIWAR